MGFNPRSVEPKYRLVAWVLATLLLSMALLFASYDLYRIFETQKNPKVAGSISSKWGSFPNIWLCPGAIGSQHQIIPASAVYRRIGSGEVDKARLPQVPYRTHDFNLSGNALKEYKGYSCAFFNFNAITDEEDMPMELVLEADMAAPASRRMQSARGHYTTVDWERDMADIGDANTINIFNIIAESVADPAMNIEEWWGEIGTFFAGKSGIPVQSCSLHKDYIGWSYLFSKELQAKFDCPAKGSNVEVERIVIFMKVRRDSANVALKISVQRQVFEKLASFGGIISVVSTIFALFFVLQHSKYERLTLRGNQIIDEDWEHESEDQSLESETEDEDEDP